MTVRRDIQTLEDSGKVFLISGGVRLAEQLVSEPSRKVKSALQSAEKAAIAQLAAEHVTPGATIYLDAGTTSLAIAMLLVERDDITVLTNDFAVLGYLMEHGQCEMYHTGGHVIRKNESCDGESAARFIASVNIDVAFISSSSWDMHHVSTPTESKVPVKRAVVAASAQSILVSDSTKYGKIGLFKAIPMKDLDAIITDDGLDPHVRKTMIASGVNVRVAS